MKKSSPDFDGQLWAQPREVLISQIHRRYQLSWEDLLQDILLRLNRTESDKGLVYPMASPDAAARARKALIGRLNSGYFNCPVAVSKEISADGHAFLNVWLEHNDTRVAVE